MRRIELNDYLSTGSRWPRRLLGWESFDLRRDRRHVAKEYDDDRYAPLLALTSHDIEDYKRAEFDVLNMAQSAAEYFSLGEEIFQAPLSLIRDLWYAVIRDVVGKYRRGTICELGAGY